jgi:glycosyltransferase involved in cell wall biosynthesis
MTSSTQVRVAVLANGHAGAFEETRAKVLSAGLPPESVRILTRTGGTWHSWTAWKRELEAWGPDVLYSINTALPAVPFGLLWARRRRIPFVLDTGDLVFEMARRSGVEPRWRWPLLWLGEQLAWRGSNVIVVRSSCFQEHLQGLGYCRVEVIRDGFHPAPPPNPEAVAELKRSLGLEGHFVLGIMGSLVWSPRLEICYGWDLIEALALLRDLPVRGLIIGDGDGRKKLERKACALGVQDRVVFAGRIPYDHVPLYLRVMDVGLSTQTNNLPGQIRTTGKVPEYMAAGVFILASRVGEVIRILPEDMLLPYEGEVDMSHPKRIAGRIRDLISEPDRLAQSAELKQIADALCGPQVLRTSFLRAIGSHVRSIKDR